MLFFQCPLYGKISFGAEKFFRFMECLLDDRPIYRDFSIRVQPKIHPFQAPLPALQRYLLYTVPALGRFHCIIYFGAMFFEVCDRIFLRVIIFKVPSPSRFMMSTKVLMKEFACNLIHVRNTFNCRLSFKMVLLMYLVIVEKMVYHSCDQETFGMTFSKKICKTMAEVALI